MNEMHKAKEVNIASRRITKNGYFVAQWFFPQLIIREIIVIIFINQFLALIGNGEVFAIGTRKIIYTSRKIASGRE